MDALYLTTLSSPSQCKKLFQDGLFMGRPHLRIAFVGRSNVGKSSLINELLGSKAARVSKTPGKTQALHFFDWRKAKKILVDLPGYGFARRSLVQRDEWRKLIEAYFRADQGLGAVVLLCDARNGPSVMDFEAIDFIRANDIPFVIAMTKCDAVRGQSARAKRKKEVARLLSKIGYDEKRIYWISSHTSDGIPSLVNAIRSLDEGL